MYRNMILLIIITLPGILFAQVNFGNFTNASSLSINPNGFIFVSDLAENEVYKLDTLGNVIKTIGGYGWDEYSFDSPVDVFATTLNVYISDKNNNRVKYLDKDLNFISDFTSDLIENKDYSFGYPTCASVSNQGDLYILDSDNIRILKYNLHGLLLQEIGSYDAGDFMLSDPSSFVFSNNMLFVADGDKLVIFDQFGMGLNQINLNFTPVNLNISFSNLVISGKEDIFYIDLSERSFVLRRLIELDNLPGEFVDAVVFNQKIYLLLNNTIFVYKINPVK